VSGPIHRQSMDEAHEGAQEEGKDGGLQGPILHVRLGQLGSRQIQYI
jgi:hypothetical protein